ncbi:hypothetical protein GWI33_010752 [Rhynchophorus ferrugineus]|uniref:Uncharacterized protein n=1 Tax=Rhynchophorus ferrugineus TaxID=354439 RepID=A0A834ISP7_RHYFE|nr:hypothetical protein GWI33_010752 [Rhynchophorus ferrugineus]
MFEKAAVARIRYENSRSKRHPRKIDRVYSRTGEKRAGRKISQPPVVSRRGISDRKFSPHLNEDTTQSGVKPRHYYSLLGNRRTTIRKKIDGKLLSFPFTSPTGYSIHLPLSCRHPCDLDFKT